MWLTHVGKQEVHGLIDMIEDEWDQLMLFDPAAFGKEGGVDPSIDPQQEYGLKGKMPRLPAKKFMEERRLTSNHLVFQSQYELLATEAYLKADPNQPLKLFEIRHLYWMFIL